MCVCVCAQVLVAVFTLISSLAMLGLGGVWILPVVVLSGSVSIPISRTGLRQGFQVTLTRGIVTTGPLLHGESVPSRWVEPLVAWVPS